MDSSPTPRARCPHRARYTARAQGGLAPRRRTAPCRARRGACRQGGRRGRCCGREAILGSGDGGAAWRPAARCLPPSGCRTPGLGPEPPSGLGLPRTPPPPSAPRGVGRTRCVRGGRMRGRNGRVNRESFESSESFKLSESFKSSGQSEPSEPSESSHKASVRITAALRRGGGPMVWPLCPPPCRPAHSSRLPGPCHSRAGARGCRGADSDSAGRARIPVMILMKDSDASAYIARPPPPLSEFAKQQGRHSRARFAGLSPRRARAAGVSVAGEHSLPARRPAPSLHAPGVRLGRPGHPSPRPSRGRGRNQATLTGAGRAQSPGQEPDSPIPRPRDRRRAGNKGPGPGPRAPGFAAPRRGSPPGRCVGPDPSPAGPLPSSRRGCQGPTRARKSRPPPGGGWTRVAAPAQGRPGQRSALVAALAALGGSDRDRRYRRRLWTACAPSPGRSRARCCRLNGGRRGGWPGLGGSQPVWPTIRTGCHAA